MTDPSNLNLALNGILRDLDTLLGKGLVPDQDLLKSKLDALHKCILDNPDKDVPNNVFIGVSNRTRLICMAGAGFAVGLTNAMSIEVKKFLDNDRN